MNLRSREVKIMNNKKPKLSKYYIATAKRLLKYVTETYKARFILVFVCIFLSAVASISVSLSLKYMLDDFILPLIGQKSPDYTEFYRDPFLLIDEVNELEVGKRVKATKYIKAEDFWFKGHFPNYPVTPGVLMVEMCAQAGAVALLSLPENKGKIGLFGGINNCKFRQQVVPGDKLDIEVEIIKVKGPIGVGKALASVNGKKAVSAEITFAIK
jgi:3-hydroxyacyl-[acyl-carrier-protein] dehydratase